MPRFYGFDGSTGMDLRPVGQLEAEDAARRERERRRHPMPVTTRIRLVSQPPEGLLPLSLFDRSDSPTGKACIRGVWRPFRPILRDCMWIT